MADDKNSEVVDAAKKVEPTKNTSNESMWQLINMIRLARTQQLRDQRKSELKKLTDGQAQVNFANNLRRILTLGAGANGDFSMTDELDKQLNKAYSADNHDLFDLLHGIGMRFDIDFDQDSFSNLLDSLEDNPNLKAQLEEIGITADAPPTEEQMKKLTALMNDEDNVDLRHRFKDNGMIKSRQNYSKAEKDNMIESIRLFVDQKHSLNDMSIQTLIRLESEMDQTYQYLMSVNKTFNDTVRSITRNIRGN